MLKVTSGHALSTVICHVPGIKSGGNMIIAANPETAVGTATLNSFPAMRIESSSKVTPTGKIVLILRMLVPGSTVVSKNCLDPAIAVKRSIFTPKDSVDM